MCVLTVNSEVCKSAIALYGLYVSVIKSECVTQVLINPNIRTRTRHFRHAFHPTRDNIYRGDGNKKTKKEERKKRRNIILLCSYNCIQY
jgi:hypothetical protein